MDSIDSKEDKALPGAKQGGTLERGMQDAGRWNRRNGKALMAFLFTILLLSVISAFRKDHDYFTTRGVVLSVEDLSEVDWVKKAKDANLTTIATHITPSQVASFMQSPKGKAFFRQARTLGLEVEHELHAMNDLLPRELFQTDPGMFRMNKDGQRVADYNLCVHSEKALEIVCQNVLKYARMLKPTTHRYFFWIDDGRPMCYCPPCSRYSDSEQALLLENRMLLALRTIDPKATLAHLAYLNTLQPPRRVKPEPGIFLEFAPIRRSRTLPLRKLQALPEKAHQSPALTHGQLLELLDANLKVFGKDNAQVLEYWLDVSLFSDWKKPAVRLPWNRDVFLKDIDTYASRGIRNITSFAVYIDADYVKRYPDLGFIREYGQGLKSYRP